MKENMETDVKNSGKSFRSYVKTNKTRIITTFRVVTIICCCIGLTIQTIELIEQYNQGATVVSINYENKNYNSIPGITICYPAALSMAEMADRYPHLRPTYEQYLQRMKSEENRNSNSSDDQKVYNKFINFILQSDIEMKEYFDMSIPAAKGRHKIAVKITGLSKDGSINTNSDDTPIESIVIKHMKFWYKCFTFYSHLNEKWAQLKKVITKIIIEIPYNESWFPRKLLNDYELQLSMHSADEFPRHDVVHYVDLKPNRYYSLTYNQWRTELLGEGYQTRCREYNLKDKRYDHSMRSGCFKRCVQEKLNECSDCHIKQYFEGDESKPCAQCLSRTTDLWTEENFVEDPIKRVCNKSFDRSSDEYEKQIKCLRQTSVESESKCHLECGPKCVNLYYNYQIKSASDNETPHKNVTVISIQHNQLPDQITKHLPEMTFIQFISSFGGLLGIWMGLSALAILKYIIQFFFKSPPVE